MGYGQLRKNSPISKKLTPKQDFRQSSSIETVSAVVQKFSDVNDRERKRRKSSQHRKSIYSIDFESEVLPPEDIKPVPPDGGYGWVVVIAVHLIMAMSAGFLNSLGIFYIEWRDYFDSTAAQAGLVVSLSSVVFGFISPLSVGISQKVGNRPLILLGGIVVFLGLIATSFATTIVDLMFTVGVLSAIGYGMIIGPSVLSHVDYFDKKFAIANGIAFAGISLGQLVFPPLTVELIYSFGGWRGAIFIISALMLNICVCGALLRPLKNKSTKKSKTAIQSTSQSNRNGEYDTNNSNSKEVSREACDKHNDTENAIDQVSSAGYPKRKDSISSAETIDDSVFVDVKCLAAATFEHAETRMDDNNQCSPRNNHSFVDKNRYFDAVDIVNPSSQRKRKVATVEAPILILLDYDNHTVPKLRSLNHVNKNISQKFKEIVKFLAKCYGIPDAFKSPLFVMMIPAIVSLAIGWYATITYQVARVISIGISEEDASFLLSLMGIGSLVGRTGHGWFIDRGLITSDMLLILCLGTCSASTFLVTFINLYPILATLAVVQGMTIGIVNTLVVVMIKTCAKPNYEESAVGMLYLIWGIGDLIGGVFAGYIYDLTGDYNKAFYFAGSALALATILIYCTCILKDRVIDTIFAKWVQQQKENGRDSIVQLDSVITDKPTENYDNPGFKMEEENGRQTRGINEDDVISRQEIALAQIEIHNLWESDTLEAQIV